MINENAFEKAVESATAGKPEAALVTPDTAPKSEATIVPTQEPASTKPEESKSEWDGDVNKLPPELQSWAKNIQRTFTKKAMAEADTRRLGEEYKQFQSSADYQAFQQWKQQQLTGQSASQPAVQQPQPISQQDLEDALLDPTGQKFNALIDRRVNEKIQEAAQLYSGELMQLRNSQQLQQFQQTLSDFADLNPDVIEMHEDGIMKPLLDDEMRSGKHKSYEDAVQAAYERGKAVRDKANARAMALSQGRVLEKKGAVTQTGTNTAEANIVYADKGRTFEAAFENALQGKKVKIKAKQ